MPRSGKNVVQGQYGPLEPLSARSQDAAAPTKFYAQAFVRSGPVLGRWAELSHVATPYNRGTCEQSYGVGCFWGLQALALV